ncbi:T9SS type A sorting domain-containing protein [Hymenobacter sp. YC55]|uniref:T9SS type A sorting domain-containing protein n=1 Tax=Hymenobacter sp. YC55 TaxID=3034019 RepID=UPI0023F8002A|nr:T9SS type A sorting domain-containing protein [Hymenobacter sp. YC55]MDF7812049.1 T9SS type A sorting domain-containing protein [Hymenobacter sp. YC55]
MKHFFTRMLPLASGLLAQMPATYAQTTPVAPTVKAQRPIPVLSRVQALPPGAPALLQSLVAAKASGGVAQVAQLHQRPQTKRLSSLAAPMRTAQESALVNERVIQAGVFTYRGPRGQIDRAVGVTVDAAGNFYVLGYGPRLELASGQDFITIKYSASGQQQWIARYNVAPRSGSNQPTDVKVDANGNVYVTGYTFTEASTTSNYATIKYSASGQQLWAAAYSEPGDSNDRTAEVMLDKAGNVYVEGTTTVKYSPDGQQLWTAPGGDLALDAADNVYVSRSNGITKYTATGQQLWNTPGPGGAIDLDAAGQVYITGTVDGGSGNTDYVARKYDGATGQQLWEARYNNSSNGRDEMVDAAVDAAGNVYITGNAYRSSNGSTDYATVKFSTTGQQLWAAVYNTVGTDIPGYSIDVVRRLVLDGAGNVYVTGNTQPLASVPTDFLTVKYAGASGQQVWDTRYNSVGGPRNGIDEVADLAVDATGNVYVTGTSLFSGVFTGNFTTVKYAQFKVQQVWEARFTGTGSSAEVAKDVATDASGNVYVTGYAYNGRNYDYATVKYNASGQLQWQARYNGPADNEDLPTNVVVDAAGNVYVSGTSYSATESDYATVKYSPTGQQLWVTRYNGPANGYDLAAKVKVDAAGNVYVTGSSDNGSTSSYDYATLKYTTNGQQLWATRYNGPANSFDLAADLGVDNEGNVYVTGTTYTSSQSDYATLKYDTTGQQQWEKIYNGTGNGYDEAAKIVVVSLNNVAVTGTSYGGTSTGYDFATIRYGVFDGFQSWASRYNDPANGDDVVADLAVTSQGDVVVAGTSYGGPSADYSTVRYSGSNGQLIWNNRYDGPANSYDEAKAVAVNAAGNVYVTGLSYNSAGTNDYATIEYDSNPNPNTTTSRLLWEERYNGSGNSYDEAVAIAADASNNVYVTGYSLGSGTGYDFATLKYGRVSINTGPVALAGAVPVVAARAPLALDAPGKNVQELAVYPNPTTGPTTVSFRPVQDGAAQVQVYNQLGQQVATLYEGKVRQGQHYELSLRSEKLAPGLYTCSLLVNGQRETVRVLIGH